MCVCVQGKRKKGEGTRDEVAGGIAQILSQRCMGINWNLPDVIHVVEDVSLKVNVALRCQLSDQIFQTAVFVKTSLLVGGGLLVCHGFCLEECLVTLNGVTALKGSSNQVCVAGVCWGCGMCGV